MIDTMTPPVPEGYQVDLTAVEIDALIRFHRLEALLLMNGEAHTVRADGLRRVLVPGVS